MKIVGRRLFGKVLASAPVVLSSQSARSPLSAKLNTMAYGIPMDATDESTAASRALNRKIWKAIRKSERDGDRDFHLQHREYAKQLLGGLDPDLYVLNSIPFARRVMMQMERDKLKIKETQSWKNKLVRALGGNPEDFEF